MARKSKSGASAPLALYVWLGSGVLRTENDGAVGRIDGAEGKPFTASSRFLALKARYLGKQLIRLDEYEAKYGVTVDV